MSKAFLIRHILEIIISAGLIALLLDVVIDNRRDRLYFETLLEGAYIEVSKNRTSVISEIMSKEGGKIHLTVLNNSALHLLQENRLLPRRLAIEIANYLHSSKIQISLLKEHEKNKDKEKYNNSITPLIIDINSLKRTLESELTHRGIRQPFSGKSIDGGLTWQHGAINSKANDIHKSNLENENSFLLGYPLYYVSFALKVKNSEKTEFNIEGNEVESSSIEVALLEKAALELDPDALYHLSVTYMESVQSGGDIENFDAKKYLNNLILSSKQGNTDAMRLLSQSYRTGMPGEWEKNYEKAFYWMKKSAYLRDAKSMYALAEFYREGIGTDVDINMAKFLYIQCINNLVVDEIESKCKESLKNLDE